MHSELFQVGPYKKLIRDELLVVDFLMKNIMCSKTFVFDFTKEFYKKNRINILEVL